MSTLPEIGTGSLMTSGQETEKGLTVRPGNNGRTRKGRKSLLEISQNLQSIRQDDGKRLRSMSHDVSSGDENEHHKRKKAKTDRSKSLGHVNRKLDQNRKQQIDKNNNLIKENNSSKNKSQNRTLSGRHVRFDSSSDDSFGQKGGKSFELKSSTPKPKGVQYKIGENKNGVAMEISPISSGEVSPNGPQRRAPPGTHKARLEAARERAKVWTETYSDPGPTEKSIDNEKVLRGQQIDPRRGRIPTETARSKHGQYINQDKQDGRPKAADKGRRLQSLPSKKESHVTETEERPVISAPSKEQGQLDAPMPKINTLVQKENKASTESQPVSQPGTSKATEQSISPRKPKEPAVSPQKREPENKPKIMEKTPEPDKPKETRRVEPKVTGIAGRSTKDEDDKRNSTHAASTSHRQHESPTKLKDDKRRLPADDHGPVNPTPKPAQQVIKTTENSVSPSDPNFTYYASLKQKDAGKGKSFDDSPRVQSDKSYKTDKSWTTVKSKQSSYPAGPTKSQTTYEMSQTPSLANSEKKRREVTIVDPKYVRKMNKSSGDEDDEPFMHEYEFSHHQIKHHKEFKDMTDEEKVDYFRDSLHMKPEQIRELTFHPKVTEPKVIHHAYTGVETINWTSGRIKSGRRPKSKRFSVYKKVSTVAPSQRKSAMLSKLQGVVYRKINKVYGSSPRDVRERQFFEKLAQIQLEDMQHRYEKLAEKERKQLEAKYRQREQLRHLRRKFEDDAWRRFMTQYVTSKVVEAEYKNREEYGLPNDLNDGSRRHPYAVQRSHAKRAQFAMTPKRMQRKNQKKYSNLFRFNTGPVPQSGGKPLKFEGFDAVYLDTEDENGEPRKKRQNVDALMQEARRILDQSDDDTDYEDTTPRKSQPSRRSRPDRPHHNRSRNAKHIPDDKSYKSSQSKRSSRSKSSNIPPPRTMKDLLNQRKTSEAPVNRYKASNFNAMKADLLKDSDLLNKNEKLQKPPSEQPTNDASSKSESSRHNVDQNKSQRDRSPEKVPVPVKNIRTPPDSPEPIRTKSPPNVKTVTTTQVTTVTTKTTSNTASDEPESKTEWKVKEGNVYLDNMETQMAIETERDKIDNEKIPTRGPSRASNKIDNTQQNGYSPTKTSEKSVSRNPSRISFRGQQESTAPKDLRPPRAPSRSSIFSSDVKNVNANTGKAQGRNSRASMNPINETKPQLKNKDNDSSRNVKTEIKTENVTEIVTETVTNSDRKQQQQINGLKTETVPHKTLGESKISVRQDSRRNSISSTKPQQTVSGRTSVVGIATTNGRVSPAIEKQRQPANRRESIVEKQTVTVKRKEGVYEKPSFINDDLLKKSSENVKQMNGHVSPQTRKSDNDRATPKPIVSKSVNVSEEVTENVTEKVNSETSKKKMPIRRQSVNEPKRSVDYSNSDLLSTRKAPYHDRKNEQIENKEKPKHRERPTHKRDASKGKKAPAGRRSRSRTPQRQESLVNGHGDVQMDRSQYEKIGHDGNRPTRRSGSKEGRNGSRRRSTSGGRKASKGRKRSISSERKKSKRGAGTKSRFPDINKKGGEGKISARSPTQKVTRSEAVDEYTTERVITPKPAGANQWKDLVEKYLRQPSPKVGRTDDRSLLDSNIDDDDDDDEMDIFKRAQMKYKLSVGQTDDEDSDDD